MPTFRQRGEQKGDKPGIRLFEAKLEHFYHNSSNSTKATSYNFNIIFSFKGNIAKKNKSKGLKNGG